MGTRLFYYYLAISSKHSLKLLIAVKVTGDFTFLEAKQNESWPHLLFVLCGGCRQMCHPPHGPLRKDFLPQLPPSAISTVKGHFISRIPCPMSRSPCSWHPMSEWGGDPAIVAQCSSMHDGSAGSHPILPRVSAVAAGLQPQSLPLPDLLAPLPSTALILGYSLIKTPEHYVSESAF